MYEYKTFVFMFYALDAVYDESKDEILGDYLSGLNPFLFEEEGSADPAEFEEFKKAYISFFGKKIPDSQEAHSFCKNYLEKYAKEVIVKAFEKIEVEDWVSAFEGTEERLL